MHYWISYSACQALGVLQPLLYFISPLYGQMSILEIYHCDMLYLFSAKQYYEPNVPVEVVTTYSNIDI